MAKEIVSEQKSAVESASSGQADAEMEELVHGQDPDTQLTLQQMKLLAVLVCNPDMQLAMQTVGISRATAYRWVNQPSFQAELTRQREAVLSEAMTTVKIQAKRAVNELTEMLGVQDERLRRLICNDILGHALKVREMENIDRRLNALEKADTKTGRGRWKS